MTAWNRVVHAGIATAIKDARHHRMTAQQLADETGRLGYPITRSQLANYEGERKQNLDVCELMVISAALGVPALSLLFPGLPDAQIAVLPGQSASIAQAKTRFVGDRGLLWPGNEIAALREQLSLITAAMGGMAGMGALTAVTTNVPGIDHIGSYGHDHRPKSCDVPRGLSPAPPPTTSRPRLVEVQQPQEQPHRHQMNLDEIQREERELNAPLGRLDRMRST